MTTFIGADRNRMIESFEDFIRVGGKRLFDQVDLYSGQSRDARDRFDLRQNRGHALFVTRDRGRLAASSVLPVAHCHDDNSRRSASTTRSAKRFVQRPALFVGVEGYHSHYPSSK